MLIAFYSSFAFLLIYDSWAMQSRQRRMVSLSYLPLSPYFRSRTNTFPSHNLLFMFLVSLVLILSSDYHTNCTQEGCSPCPEGMSGDGFTGCKRTFFFFPLFYFFTFLPFVFLFILFSTLWRQTVQLDYRRGLRFVLH